VNNEALEGLSRISLERKFWRKRKHGFVRLLPLVIRNGITVARVHTSSMLANTCCTALLLQGAPASPP
jgi:hypothetical protein